ncbi:MAG: ABC transporter permease [Lachnospiraceae bacterium]|nr:ABC transporter permease [Lachnospiraceae bacterium]
MGQKLSAMNYIKNNKRRSAVLIVSLSLCFMLIYLTKFLLSSTEETFKVITVDNAEKIQYVTLTAKTLGIDVENIDMEEYEKYQDEKYLEIVEKLKKHENIENVYYSECLYSEIWAVIGSWYAEIPLVEANEVTIILEHFGTKVCRGRMPEKPGEIVLDEGSMKNGGYVLDGYYRMDEYDKSFKIVGILDCDTYFGCGIPSEAEETSKMLTILSDGSVEDLKEVLKSVGVNADDKDDQIVDVKNGREDLKTNVTDVISSSTNIIYICIIVLISLALFIVYTMYLRDRHNEWCLYSSIGYSRKDVYSLVMREVLITFLIAFVVGIILTVISVVSIDSLMLKAQGLKCKYIYPESITEILAAFIVLIGALQIPIRYALNRIKTVDAIEDDIY